MNTNLYFLLVFLVFLNTASAQFNVNTNPYWSGEIKLQDGTLKKGLIMVPNSTGEDYIAFKASESGRKETLKRKLIEYVLVTSENGHEYLYENLPVAYTIKGDRTKGSKLLLVFAKNNHVTFYIESGVYKVSQKSGEIQLIYRANYGNDLPATYYYIRKKESTNANMFALTGQNIVGLNGKLKKSARYHLTEAPELIKKIEKKEYKHTDIPTIIDAYVSLTSTL